MDPQTESIEPQRTVRDIVVEHPETLEVFEDVQIDYCCGGGKTLAEAAGMAGLTVAPFIERLRQAVDASDGAADGRSDISRRLAGAPLHEVVEHVLTTHHVYLRQVLPRLDALFEKVLAAHGDRHGETVLEPLRRVFRGLRDEISAHLQKEEMVLFPLIRSLEEYRSGGRETWENHCGSMEHPIRQMTLEHDNAGNALAEMRRISGSYRLPADACPTFAALYEGLQNLEEDLHQHIHLENNILFPRAIRMEAGVDRG